MSALGQKRTFRNAIGKSALPPEADIRRSAVRVRCHRPARGPSSGPSSEFDPAQGRPANAEQNYFQCGVLLTGSALGVRSLVIMVPALQLGSGKASVGNGSRRRWFSFPVFPRSLFLGGGNDVTRPSNASSAAADRGIRLADHRCGVHHVRGRAGRSWSASAADQQFDVAAKQRAVCHGPSSHLGARGWSLSPRADLFLPR
jgi:hypothetical protein